MTSSTPAPRQAATASMDETDLRAVVEAMDEHLSFWNILNHTPGDEPVGEPLLPPLAQMRALADQMQMSSAPLYPSQGAGGLRAILYRVFNLLIKLVGQPQIAFNRPLRDYLSEHQRVLAAQYTLLNTQSAALAQQARQITVLQERIHALEVQNSEHWQEIQALQQQIEDHSASAHG